MNEFSSARLTLAGVVLGVAAGCRSTSEPAVDSVEIILPATLSAPTAEGAEVGAEPWWKTFGEESLDRSVDRVLDGNFELRQAWSRLRQSEASARAAGAPRIPSLDGTASARYQEIQQSGSGGFNIPIRTGETYSLGLSLGYEIDLFGRIDSTLKAARLEEAATAADVRATGLALSGRAVDAWLTIVERSALTDLVGEQILAGEQLLELTEARFATAGTGSALDVLQQRRQLEGTRAELPLLAGEVERARYQLAVLTGEAPSDQAADAPRELPTLPPLPVL
ncbi:MAG: TolC family protein, partial [Planctomycetota bacterium]